MPRTYDRTRLPIALNKISKEGMSITKAFREAGYSKNYGTQGLKPKVKALVKNAQNEFVSRYMNNSEKIGLTPESISGTVFNVMKTGKNIEKIMAVNAHTKVILHSLDIQARVSKWNTANTINVQQNFIIPPSVNEKDWKPE